MEERVFWIWLSLACTPGSTTFAKLLACFDGARAVYEADDDAIASAITSRSKDFSRLTDKSLERAESVLEYCISKEIGILAYDDRNFPSLLKQIPTPPVLLYYRGKLPDFDSSFFVSVVGTRRLSDYGRKNAFTISYDLARAGALIVSGMAIGIDGVAHAGAVAAGKPTVAVIGSGIDVLYPKQHGRLAREIVKSGCVLTEYAPGTRPEGQNFPVRNRIISGLGSALFVVEGRERSGALITARHAREQERRVYALPGNVGNANSELTNLLIKSGASLCTCADDIVRDFELKSHGRLNPHELARSAPVNMADVLKFLGISCVSQGDDIFKPARTKREKAEPKPSESAPEPPKAADMSDFDAKALKIYKKIPVGAECDIESLTDGELPMRDVMRGLLKLEMGRFVTMLPGERVKRNF